MTIAYIVINSIISKESFTFNEIVMLKQLGINIRIFSLCKKNVRLQILRDITEYINLILPSSFKAHLFYFIRKPKSYLKLLFYIIKRFSLKDVYVFLKSIVIAFKIKESDIFHLHSPYATSGATVCLLISRLTGIPFSFKVHAWDLFCGGSMLGEKVNEASFIVAISEYNKKYIIDKFGIEYARKIYVIHCGVDLSEFPYKETNREGKDILSIATFTEKKGTEYLLKAVKLLKDNENIFEVVLGGMYTDHKQKKYKRRLERYIKENNLKDNISIIDNPDRNRVRNLMRESGLFVLPSIIAKNGDRDGIPVVLMEAMASGLPVISTSVSGIPELVIDNETGILANPGDPVDLAEKIRFLHSEKAIQDKLRKNARKKIDIEFNVAKNSIFLKKLFISYGRI